MREVITNNVLKVMSGATITKPMVHVYVQSVVKVTEDGGICFDNKTIRKRDGHQTECLIRVMQTGCVLKNNFWLFHCVSAEAFRGKKTLGNI